MKKIFSTLVLLAALAGACRAQELLKPDGTWLYAEKDSTQLFLDIYYPADGSEMQVDGVNKPTVLYVFGGGFKEGRRDSRSAKEWFRLLTDEGLTVIAIDYRLGLKDMNGMGIGQIRNIYNAIQMAVDDLFSATAFIIENSEELDIDTSSIIISGSSAGGITVLQADWELCNRMHAAAVLPEDFRYAGVMSFAGAIFSRRGKVRYKLLDPAPTLMFHGTSDKIVNYGRMHFFNLSFQGSGSLSRTYKNRGYDYNIYRFKGNNHEIASAMVTTFPEQMRWIETNIIRKEERTVDATVNDPSIEIYRVNSLNSLYRKSNE